MRFRLRSLFVLIVLVAIVCAAPSVWQQIQFRRFISYSNRDLRTLSDDALHEFSEISKSIVPQENEPLIEMKWSHVPWYIWPVETATGTRYLYLRGSPCFRIPGISSAHIHVINSSGTIVRKTEFSTGYRITINDAKIHACDNAEFIFRIESEPVINGRDVSAQFYALIRDQILLIRLEDSSGQPIENYANNMKIGDDTPEFVESDWVGMLESGHRVEQLAALAYLQVNPQPDTMQALKSLTSSDDQWIADSARLAEGAIPSGDRGTILRGAAGSAR